MTSRSKTARCKFTGRVKSFETTTMTFTCPRWLTAMCIWWSSLNSRLRRKNLSISLLTNWCQVLALVCNGSICSDVAGYFSFVNFKKNLKVSLNPIVKKHFASALIQNCTHFNLWISIWTFFLTTTTYSKTLFTKVISSFTSCCHTIFVFVFFCFCLITVKTMYP